MQAEVIVYTTATCPYCIQAKTLLDKKHVTYREIRIDLDDKARETMMAKSGRRTVPQIFIDGQPIGGCDDLYQLDKESKLDALLVKKK